MTTFTCDLCHNHDYQLLYPERGQFTDTYLITDRSYGQHLPIVQCTTCSLIQVYPQIAGRQTASRYQDFVDPEYEHESGYRSQNCDRVLVKLATYLPTHGRLLDVGCATGIMLTQAIAAGLQAEGIEPSKWAARIGHTKGLKIYQGTLGSVQLRSASFDAITCVDVIEHVISPRQLVRQMVQLLKPGGVLCIVTPSIDSLVARVLGEKWWHIRPDHFYYFTRNSLSNLLISSGFQIEEMKSYAWTFSLDYWVSRLKLQLPRMLADFSLTLNFHDSLEVYVRKI